MSSASKLSAVSVRNSLSRSSMMRSSECNPAGHPVVGVGVANWKFIDDANTLKTGKMSEH